MYFLKLKVLTDPVRNETLTDYLKRLRPIVVRWEVENVFFYKV